MDSSCTLCQENLSSPTDGQLVLVENEDFRKLLQQNLELEAFEDEATVAKICRACFVFFEEICELYGKLRIIQKDIGNVLVQLKARVTECRTTERKKVAKESFEVPESLSRPKRKRERKDLREPSISEDVNQVEEVLALDSEEIKEEIETSEDEYGNETEFCEPLEVQREEDMDKNNDEDLHPNYSEENEEESPNDSEAESDSEDPDYGEQEQVESSDEDSIDSDDLKKLILEEILSESDENGEKSSNSRSKTSTTMMMNIKTQRRSQPKEYNCEKCSPNKTFPTALDLSRHFEMGHKDSEKLFYCDKLHCDKRFLTFELLLIHTKFQHFYDGRVVPGYPLYHRIYCNFCRRHSFLPEDMRKHELEVHSEKLKYFCDICGLRFFKQEILDAHNICHSEESESLICRLCSNEREVIFENATSLESHLLRMHNFPRYYLKKDVQRIYDKSKPLPSGSSGPITCEKCHRIFPKTHQSKAFLRHKCNELPFHCDLCPLTDRGFPTEKRFVLHLARHHEAKNPSKSKSNQDPNFQFRCDKCSKEFVTTTMFKRHMNCHYLEERLKYHCSPCETRFDSEKDLTTHNRNYHLPAKNCRSRSCAHCENKFVNLFHLRKHERNEHPDMFTYACKEVQCEEKYSKPEFLQTHLLTHKKTGPYSCSLCPLKVYKSGEKLEQHLIECHTVGKAKPCSKCPELFHNERELSKHMTVKHGEPWMCQCSVCGRGFSSKYLLKGHKERMHDVSEEEKRKNKPQEPSFQCSVCGKMFMYKVSMRNHTRTVHEKPTVLVCELCGKTVTSNQSMKHHMRSHLGEKNYACEFCDKRFVRADTLRYHRYTHTGEKPFICHICGTGFNQRSPLKQHENRHKKDGSWFPKPKPSNQ